MNRSGKILMKNPILDKNIFWQKILLKVSSSNFRVVKRELDNSRIL